MENSDILRGWKAISAYLGGVSKNTVKKNSYPVYKENNEGMVWANRTELDKHRLSISKLIAGACREEEAYL